jgi:hypothetical protein
LTTELFNGLHDGFERLKISAEGLAKQRFKQL